MTNDLFKVLQWSCGKVCGAPAEQELGNKFMRMDRDSYVPDLLAASDCMLGTTLINTLLIP